MNKSSKEKLVSDIENRLDAFFETDENEATAAAQQATVPQLERLKSIILSIDWEITDNCLSDLINETSALLPELEDDRLRHTLLKMLNSLGRYIRKRKAQAHPDAIKRILSVYASVEKISSPGTSGETLKKRIVAKEIAAFKKLKEQIDAQKPVSQRRPPQDEKPVEPSGFVDQRKFEQTVSAVEKKLLAEVEALKANIAQMQKELNSLRKS